ncbi:hypothetical protein FEI68_10160 [Salmonella enterica subsp. enterica serovar Javiana]|nr:hypothetical protein [Salmonella enterica subsp. enterica serovar Javiana]ECD7686597.1 hypothetical protein [Salmonella enterica subsp. enterica serovar Javiana]
MKIIFKVIFLMVILILLFTPIYMYKTHMDSSLSLKNSDWGDFGSFIGGVYGSIFSSITLLVVLWSSYKTNKTSNEQLTILRNERVFNEFSEILNHLKTNYTKFYNNYDGSNTIESLYRHIEVWLGISVITYYNNTISIEKNLKNNAVLKFQEGYDKDALLKETKLFVVILNIIEKAPKDISDAMKVIFENTFSNDVRFSLEHSTRAHHPHVDSILNNWPSLSDVPKVAIDNAFTNLKLNGLI